MTGTSSTIRVILHFIAADMYEEVLFRKNESILMNLLRMKDYLSERLKGCYMLSTDLLCYEKTTGTLLDLSVSAGALHLRDGMTLEIY